MIISLFIFYLCFRKALVYKLSRSYINQAFRMDCHIECKVAGFDQPIMLVETFSN